MKHVYGVKGNSYKEAIYLVVDNYNDALKIAAATKEEWDDEKAKSLVVKLPYLATVPDKVNLCDVDHIIQMAMDSAFKAMEMATGEEK